MLSPIFNLIRLAFKILLFSLVILTLGHMVGWSGKTVSDRIRTQVAHAEHLTNQAAEQAKNWVAEKGREVLPTVTHDGVPVGHAAALRDLGKGKTEDQDPEKIPPSERQKLRNLIRELNGTQKRD